MQWAFSARIAIWSCVINGCNQGDTPSWSEIFNKSRSLVHLQLQYTQRAASSSWNRRCAVDQLVNGSDCWVKKFASFGRHQGESNTRALVTSTELTKGNNLLREINIGWVVFAWDLGSRYECTTRTRHLFLNLTAIVTHRSTHSSTTSLEIFDIGPFETPLGNFIWLSHSLGAYNDLTTSSFAFMSQVFGPDLFFGSHQLSHCYIDLADWIKVLSAITIDDHKSKLLDFLKVVR